VAKLERGELKLEESLKLFERGVELGKHCRKALDGAELKVKALLGEGPIEPS
jgi:exodeoxyribonuclease VII small subunit